MIGATLRRWIDRLFRMEEINGHEMCPTYLFRWTLLRLFGCAAYLHHFVGEDWSRDLHDHPKRFVSVGLCGGYVEETPQGEGEWRAPWVRSFPAAHSHRLRLAPGVKSCWTLVVVLRTQRPWGFWHAGRWVPWRKYVGSAAAAERKACP